MWFTNKVTESGVANKLKDHLPNFLFNFICYSYGYLVFFLGWYKKILNKNRKLKWVSKWKRAFLLATWPSIKEENLITLKDEDCFSVSNFFLHDDINVINPKFHFFAPYHKPLVLDNYIEWLKLADKTLPKETKIFLWHTTKHYVDKYKLFQDRDVYYLYLTQTPFKHNYNLCYPILSPHTWPQMIIPVLIYMWYSEIYLLWCDHNTLKTYWEEREDFYDRKKDIRENAADKNSWMWNIIEFMEAILDTFKQYKVYDKIAEKNSVKIINLSKGTWLDIFKKSELKDILINKK